MANICLYKIKLKGRRLGCEAFIRSMPSYGMDFEFFDEEGTDTDYTIGFIGDCKWSVHAYTSSAGEVALLTDEQLGNEELIDSHYYTPMIEKSILFGVEIFCNFKDIDEGGWATYEHYKDGKRIFDECPKELHIKRGRDYDRGYVYMHTDKGLQNVYVPEECDTCKVTFSDTGSYWYKGTYKIGDLVYVAGKKADILGVVTEASIFSEKPATYDVCGVIGNITLFKPEEFEAIWSSYKPAARKEYLSKIGLSTDLNKKQFLKHCENQWILKHRNEETSRFQELSWEDFVEMFKI